MLIEAFGVAATAYALTVGGMAMTQRAMIYHPGGLNLPPAAAGVPEMREVALATADGLELTAWHAPARSYGAATVVFLHGNAGGLDKRAFKARVFLDAGFGVLMVEYRGYGGNPGRPSEAGCIADALAGLDWLAAAGIVNVALYGESLGSGVAVQVAAERPLAAVILEAPFTSLAELAPAIVPLPLARLLMVDRFDSAARIAAVAAPLLVVHGERDILVPVAMGRRLLAAHRGNARGLFLPQAGHNDTWAFGAGAEAVRFLATVTG